MTSGDPVYYTDGALEEGSFSSTIGSLEKGTKYYYVAFVEAKGEDGNYHEVYGIVRSFSTAGGSSVVVPEWMELPSMSASDGCDFYAHAIDNNSKSYFDLRRTSSSVERNYSFYWSPTHHVSYWVAYLLYDEVLKKNVTRNDNYALDPIVPQSDQPAVSTYSSSGYSRGHQMPSQDRLSSRAMNNSTFFLTNITPQDSDFNGGVWFQLENKVHAWGGQCDTLYVVTGCVVDDDKSNGTIGSGNNSITVPKHYYKALLRLDNGDYSACAFYFDHFGDYDSGDWNSSPCKMSVAELENKTGIVFFPNLENKVGTTKAKSIKNTATSF